MGKTLWPGLIGVALLAIFPLFIRLDTLPLFIFDEGRLANNALEMAVDGHWVVAHYDGRPDLWNTKPPLMIWLQALFMKALGLDLLAVRLPAALAGLATILAVFLFAFRQTRSLWASLCSGLVLLCTPGFVTTHATRTGDYDALLALWSTLFLFQIYNWFREEAPSAKRKHLWLALLFFTLGVLTKGIVIFLFLPGVLIFLLAGKRLGELLRQPHFYYASLSSIAVIAAWYLGREWASPGYLEAVVQNELGGRFLEVIEEHSGTWSYYFENFWKREFIPWIGFIPLAVWLVFRDPNIGQRPLWTFVLCQALCFLLILSFAQTKLNWYALPAFPLLAIAVGGGVGLLLERAGAEWPKGLLLFGIFLWPYSQQIRESYKMDTLHSWEKRQYSGFMKKVEDRPGYIVVQTDYNAHIAFYVKKYRAEGKEIGLKYPNELSIGDTILLCEEHARKAVLDRWKLEELYAVKGCGLFKVIGRD